MHMAAASRVNSIVLMIFCALARRRRRADVRVQALASLPDSLHTFYNIYIYFLILNFTSTSGSL